MLVNKLFPPKIAFVYPPELISISGGYAQADNGYVSLYYHELETYQIRYVSRTNGLCKKIITTGLFEDNFDGSTRQRADNVYQNLMKKFIRNFRFNKGPLIERMQSASSSENITITITFQDKSCLKESFSEKELELGSLFWRLNKSALEYKNAMLSRKQVQELMIQYMK